MPDAIEEAVKFLLEAHMSGNTDPREAARLLAQLEEPEDPMAATQQP